MSADDAVTLDDGPIDQLLERAQQALHNGELQRAAGLYEAIALRVPDHLEALCTLAFIRQRQGKPQLAAQLLKQALQHHPDNPMVQLNLGSVQLMVGDTAAAIASYRRARELAPEMTPAHIGLGRALRASGKSHEAITALQRALELEPNNLFALNTLGLAQLDAGQISHACASFERIVEHTPDHINGWYNLGNARLAAGASLEAEQAYARALELAPDLVEAHINRGSSLRQRGQRQDAIGQLEAGLAIAPDHAGLLNELGACWFEEGDATRAEALFARAVEADPRHHTARLNLARCLRSRAALGEAEAQLRSALELHQDGTFYGELGHTLKLQGRMAEAVEAYRAALQWQVEPSIYSGYLLALHYGDLPALDGTPVDHAFIRAEHDRYGRTYLRHTPVSLQPARPATERLRVGYLSSDMRGHSVSYFLEPVLRGHDRQQVELFGFSDVAKPDATTERLSALFDHLHAVSGEGDDGLKKLIESYDLDVLVELNGHTGQNRLPLLARRLAPLQLSYIGYPHDSGVAAIDHHICDAITDPPEADGASADRRLRIDTCFLCYQPPAEAPDPSAPPYLDNGYVTFGSFNNMAKLTPSLLTLWGELVAAVAGARLLLKNPSLDDESTRARVLQALADAGLPPERVELLGLVPSTRAHLDSYSRIDIALDPFPYNGTTTTCEALWMGVPVLALHGEAHAGRVAASLLKQVAMDDWCVADIATYRRRGIELAAAPGQLAELRQTLRERMRTSPLCNEQRMATSLERAYREALERKRQPAQGSPAGPAEAQQGPA